MLLYQVTIYLALIGSAVVGKLADGCMGCPRLKWVAPMEVHVALGAAPLDPAASLVLLLSPLDLTDSVLTVFDAVGQ